VILDAYRLGERYGVFTRWNDYVYKNLPIDDAYWRMRAFGEYVASSQLGAREENAIPHRTFELWLYTDLGGEKPRIVDTPLEEIDYTLLRLCSGKLSKQEVIQQGRAMIDPVGAQTDFYKRAEESLHSMEKKKWILYQKP